jgi:hypothetical protein
VILDVFGSAGEANPELRQDIDSGAARVVLVVAPDGTRRATAGAIARRWAQQHPDAVVIAAPAAARWPFTQPLVPSLPDRPTIVWAEDVHEAMINRQTRSTRLVTTQATYLFDTWNITLAGREDVLLLCTADRNALQAHALEALEGRGPFRRAFVYQTVDGTRQTAVDWQRTDDRETMEQPTAHGLLPTADGCESLLARAFRESDPAERLALCVRALDYGRTAPVLLAIASTCMEVNDLEAAGRDLDEALALAPEWAAAHFERGKLWLRLDDMERASGAFREAAERLPSFASAWANLGATLGELDRPEEALAAFQHALTADPVSPGGSTSQRRRSDVSLGSCRTSPLDITIWATRCSCRAAIMRRWRPTAKDSGAMRSAIRSRQVGWRSAGSPQAMPRAPCATCSRPSWGCRPTIGSSC